MQSNDWVMVDWFCRDILRTYAHDDISVGSWFIGLDVKHVHDTKVCCSSRAGGLFLSLSDLFSHTHSRTQTITWELRGQFHFIWVPPQRWFANIYLCSHRSYLCWCLIWFALWSWRKCQPDAGKRYERHFSHPSRCHSWFWTSCPSDEMDLARSMLYTGDREDGISNSHDSCIGSIIRIRR